MTSCQTLDVVVATGIPPITMICQTGIALLLVWIPNMALLFVLHLVLIASYATVCYIGRVLFIMFYPRVVVENYTNQKRKLVSAIDRHGAMMDCDKGLCTLLTWMRPSILMAAVCYPKLLLGLNRIYTNNQTIHNFYTRRCIDSHHRHVGV